MIRIKQIKVPIAPQDKNLFEPGNPDLEERLAISCGKELHVKREQIEKLIIRRQSIDARKKPQLYYVYTVDVILRDTGRNQEEKLCRKCRDAEVISLGAEEYRFPESGSERLKFRPIVVGSGPAGLFCAYFLAQNGYCPIVLERGANMEERVAAVDSFWKEEKELDVAANVQFGEGGAGTFSDGKLNTLVKDTYGRYQEMLRVFVEHGAPPDILYRSKPHIGTDCLRTVIQKMRNHMISMGAEFRFRSQVTDFAIEEGHIKAVELNHEEWLPCQQVVLAIGHSARDTFECLLEKHHIPMEEKAFAVGLRIEHPQRMINENQYGEHAPGWLPACDYKLTGTSRTTGRGVYSFCMCPGGYVVNASSEPGRLAVNGMSNHRRDSANANSALIMTVAPGDFPKFLTECAMGRQNDSMETGGGTTDQVFQKHLSSGILKGMQFQRVLEERAYSLGKGRIPVQLWGDFQENRVSSQFGEVMPCTKGNTQFANLRELLPAELSISLMEGMEQFSHRIHGFSRYDAVLSGIESRTSSPVRILRGDSFESLGIFGLYPCGEGAGYAGGISSAAIDGMKVAEAIAVRYQKPHLL